MLLVVRIITILCIFIGLIIGGWLTIAGILDTPEKDIDAIWIGVGFILYYLADAWLLYRSYKRKHAVTHWVAFVFSLLPVLIIAGIVMLADFIDS